MKVIDRREPPGQFPRRITCTTCSSVLEVEAADITLPGQRDGAEGWFRCPVCTELVYTDRQTTNDSAKLRNRKPRTDQNAG